MLFLETFALSIGVSMDAFAVSLCKGLSQKRIRLKHCILIGGWFGGFQMLMPLIGYYAGSYFEHSIKAYDHWVIFALLCLIGLQMIKESRSNETETLNDSFGFRSMLPLAIATSLDALAVGISLSLIDDMNVFFSLIMIGLTTFSFSAIGLLIGSRVGTKYKSKAELLGGIILIVIAFKILLEHLGLLL